MYRTLVILSGFALATPLFAGWGVHHGGGSGCHGGRAMVAAPAYAYAAAPAATYYQAPAYSYAAAPAYYQAPAATYYQAPAAAYYQAPASYVPVYYVAGTPAPQKPSDAKDLYQFDLNDPASVAAASAVIAGAPKRLSGQRPGGGCSDEEKKKTETSTEFEQLKDEVAKLKESVETLADEVKKIGLPEAPQLSQRDQQWANAYAELKGLERNHAVMTVREDKQATEQRHAQILDSLKLPATP